MNYTIILALNLLAWTTAAIGLVLIHFLYRRLLMVGGSSSNTKFVLWWLTSAVVMAASGWGSVTIAKFAFTHYQKEILNERPHPAAEVGPHEGEEQP